MPRAFSSAGTQTMLLDFLLGFLVGGAAIAMLALAIVAAEPELPSCACITEKEQDCGC